MHIPTIHLKFRAISEETFNVGLDTLRKIRLLKKFERRSKANLDVLNTTWHSKHGSNDSELLFLLSIYSASKHLKGIDETMIKVFPDIDDFQSYFRAIYEFTREIWHNRYPINIVFTGGDVVFKRDVSFSSFSGFQMFNYAHSQQIHRSRIGDRKSVIGGDSFFEHYLNADVRYFSHDMDKTLWEIGDSWSKDWVHGIWEYEQDLYNAMLRAQGYSRMKIEPQLAFQLPSNEAKDKKLLRRRNGISLDDAQIVHLHSTRGPSDALELALKLIFS